MALAQGLYEGQDVGNAGATGLITYMRTDSPHVSDTALGEVRDFVLDKYGADFLPEQAPEYKSKSATAQEAHEAIRPTSVLREPESIRSFLEPAMYRLYNLIWQRLWHLRWRLQSTTQLQVEVKRRGARPRVSVGGHRGQRFGFLATWPSMRRRETRRSSERRRGECQDPSRFGGGAAPRISCGCSRSSTSLSHRRA